MKATLTTFVAALFAVLGMGIAQDTKPAEPPAANPLEAKFVAAFTNATLTGRWCAIKDGRLGPEKEEQYKIVGVTKLGGDRWQIRARIQYGGQAFDAPIPAEVKWAGDTAVLIVDDLSMGGAATYSARVMISGQTYAGTWSGGNHGGLLSGVITNAKE
jgi:hypothetical protein